MITRLFLITGSRQTARTFKALEVSQLMVRTTECDIYLWLLDRFSR